MTSYVPRVPKRVTSSSKYQFGWKGEKSDESDNWTKLKQQQVEAGRLAAHYLGEVEKAIDAYINYNKSESSKSAEQYKKPYLEKIFINYILYKITKDIFDAQTKVVLDKDIEIQIVPRFGGYFGTSIRDPNTLDLGSNYIRELNRILRNGTSWIVSMLNFYTIIPSSQTNVETSTLPPLQALNDIMENGVGGHFDKEISYLDHFRLIQKLLDNEDVNTNVRNQTTISLANVGTGIGAIKANNNQNGENRNSSAPRSTKQRRTLQSSNITSATTTTTTTTSSSSSKSRRDIVKKIILIEQKLNGELVFSAGELDQPKLKDLYDTAIEDGLTDMVIEGFAPEFLKRAKQVRLPLQMSSRSTAPVLSSKYNSQKTIEEKIKDLEAKIQNRVSYNAYELDKANLIKVYNDAIAKGVSALRIRTIAPGFYERVSPASLAGQSYVGKNLPSSSSTKLSSTTTTTATKKRNNNSSGYNSNSSTNSTSSTSSTSSSSSSNSNSNATTEQNGSASAKKGGRHKSYKKRISHKSKHKKSKSKKSRAN